MNESALNNRCFVKVINVKTVQSMNFIVQNRLETTNKIDVFFGNLQELRLYLVVRYVRLTNQFLLLA